MGPLGTVYRVEVVGAALLAGTSVLGGSLVLMGLVRPASDESPLVLVTAVIILVFLVLNLGLRALAGKAVSFPFPTAWQRKVSNTALVVFLVTMGYGVLRWPHAPVRATEARFVDKSGREYTHEAFMAFKRWEAAFVLLCLPLALVALTDLPARNLGAAQQADEADKARAG